MKLKLNCLTFILHPSAFILTVNAMLYKRSLSSVLAALLLVSQVAARQQQGSSRAVVVDAARLRQHVTYLASDKLEGRRTGEPGAQEAARYVARELARYGVQPGSRVNCDDTNDSCYMQEFPYV